VALVIGIVIQASSATLRRTAGYHSLRRLAPAILCSSRDNGNRCMNEIDAPAVVHGPQYDLRGLGFAARDVVVITGGGSGIGKATAIMAAKSGISVAVWDMNMAAAEESAAEISSIGGVALAVAANVGDDGAVAKAWEATKALGPCRYLVNNAGPGSSSTAPFNDNITLAVGSVHRVMTSWLALHAEQAKSVVNISSVTGNFQGGGLTTQAFYPTAKGAIAAYTRYLATHYRGQPRANAVAPGFTSTPRTIPYLDSPAMRKSIASIPMERAGFPEEIAAAILFLLSPAAAYINGVLLPVDGGWIHA
jgi:NAD(P)-dependent dehydrogenase (short-subunit alcohol dehydrogenase family)